MSVCTELNLSGGTLKTISGFVDKGTAQCVVESQIGNKQACDGNEYQILEQDTLFHFYNSILFSFCVGHHLVLDSYSGFVSDLKQKFVKKKVTFAHLCLKQGSATCDSGAKSGSLDF